MQQGVLLLLMLLVLLIVLSVLMVMRGLMLRENAAVTADHTTGLGPNPAA